MNRQQNELKLTRFSAGYLQAAVYKGLNGTLGKEGWQWLFIMDGVISLPICLLGFFLIPDLPENSRAFYLTEDDRDLAKKRMEEVGRAPYVNLLYLSFKEPKVIQESPESTAVFQDLLANVLSSHSYRTLRSLDIIRKHC